MTRPKVVRFLGEHLADKKAELLAALGWDGEGNIREENGERIAESGDTSPHWLR
jgi:hypothetical protein